MDIVYILVALGLVALNAFFVATEFAIVKVRTTRIEELVVQGVRRAAATRDVIRNMDAYLSACQLGITLASLGLGWVGEPAFAHLVEPAFARLGPWQGAASHSAAVVFSFLLITFLHTVFGELAPKTLAIERSEKVALLVSWPMRVFHFLFFPLIWTLNGSANLAVRLMGLHPVRSESAHSEEELRMIIATSHRGGILSGSHLRLLENALDFADQTVRQIMVPRGDIVFLDVNRTYDENIAIARKSGHTRYPLCDGELDRVLGTVHIKNLFLHAGQGDTAVDLRAIAREPLFFPESLPIEQALATFQSKHLHLGTVIDEYGGASGMVTLEDVIEELIGEIQDEFDEESPQVQPLADGRLLVDAAFPLDDLHGQLGIREEVDDEIDTLGGLVVTRLGRIARPGDAVVLGGRRVEVQRTRGRRILRLVVHPEEARPEG